MRLSGDSVLSTVANLLSIQKLPSMVFKSGISTVQDFGESLGVVDIEGFCQVFDGVSLEYVSRMATLKTMQGFINVVNFDAILNRVSLSCLLARASPLEEDLELMETIAGVKDIAFVEELVSGIDFSDAVSSVVLASQLGVEFDDNTEVLRSAVKKRFLSMVYEIVGGKTLAEIRNQLGV